MEVKRVQCPQCGSIYDIPNSKGEPERIFACKKCQKKLRVKFSNPPVNNDEPIDAITVNPKDNGKTQYHRQNTTGITNNTIIAQKKGKKGILCVNGREYELREGVNTVGRKSANSTASLQLDVNDPYLSRRHSKINCVNMGKPTFKAIISNDQNKNMTCINNTPLGKDDEIVLTDGCTIKMADTIVIYKEV